MPAPLTPEEDANPVVPFKVRRRAQAVRPAAQGWTAPPSTATSGGGPKGE
jgi:hypothetical protein